MTVENGRRLKPTNLGIVLVHGYYKIGKLLQTCLLVRILDLAYTKYLLLFRKEPF